MFLFFVLILFQLNIDFVSNNDIFKWFLVYYNNLGR